MKRRTIVIALCSAMGACVPGLAQAVNAFVQGAQPAFPTSPVPMPPANGFQSLGTIPASNSPSIPGESPPVNGAAPMTQPPPLQGATLPGAAMPGASLPGAMPEPMPVGRTPGSVPAMPYQGAGRLPSALPGAPLPGATLPYGGYVPPPVGASPQMIAGDAANMDGMAEPPHMTMQEAMKDGTMVRQQDIRARPGKTYSILVSGVAPNLIETPFRHPQLLVNNNKLATPIIHGRDIIVSVSPAFPVGAYVTGRNPHDPMVSLTLIPKKTPPKNYRLIIPGFIPSTAPAMPAHNAYAARMVGLMRDMALKKVPGNYRQSHKKTSLPGAGGALAWSWEFSWVGSHYRLSAYAVENTLGRPVNLMETNFYAKNVVAVSLYPKHHLYPDEKSQIFVITRLAAAKSDGLGGVS